MANFILTNVCNLSCPFCFASEYHEEETSRNAARMPMEEYLHQLRFVGEAPVRFCGGEPTLHPQFTQMLDAALELRGRQVFMMSNGVWPNPVLEHVQKLRRRDAKRLGFLFNVLSEEHYGPGQREQLHRTLSTVRKDRVTLGVTLYQVPYDFSHLFDLVRQYGFKRVRYSVAAPNVTDASSWNVDPHRDFPRLATVVYEITMKARSLGLYVHSDCGYLPPCMFTEQQLQDMYPPGDPELEDAFSCRGPVDIGPGGEAWRCYGLYSSMRAKTEEFPDAAALGDFFERRTAETTYADLFDDCATCEIKERYRCAGGCYALRSVGAMQVKAQTSLVSIGDDPRFHHAVAAIESDNVVFTRDGDSGAVMLKEADGTWAKMRLSPWEGVILASCDGTRTVKEIIDSAQASSAPRQKGPSRSAARVIRRFYEQGAITLSRGNDATS